MNTLTMSSKRVAIIDFSPEYRGYFKTLNYEWIEKYFLLEEKDRYVLSNPEEAIIDKGGFIFFALYEGQVVGTCAMTQVTETVFQIGKMAVAAVFQKMGIGKELMKRILQKAGELKLQKLELYSNTRLVAAINMYINFGFRLTPKNDFHSQRANIKMELKLLPG